MWLNKAQRVLVIGVGKNHSQRFEETHPNLAEKFSLILNVAILLWWVRKKHVHGINYINHPSRFSFVKEERGICYPDNSAVTMTPTVSFSVFAIALLIVGTSANEEQVLGIFGYGGKNGPDHWGELSSKYSSCSNGKWQSPVDIVKDKVVRNKNMKPLIRDYGPANATLVNNGFNIAINFGGHLGVLVADGKNFTFKHMHWHSPSEHQIDGHRFPVEMHMVHEADDGSFAVVSTLYRYGDPDPLLSKIKGNLDELAKEKCAEHEEAHIPLGYFNTRWLMRKTRKYYRYYGSLTTPPCTEKIMWNILGKVRSISKDQIEALKKPLVSNCKENSRPVRPLNGRLIELYDELGGKQV
ncbi:alpha carbonic anhydrase 1, chloroplastic-like [Carya illinoinensis]|uniref:Carbonic anhydrase n=1 Tax=Carya illinoinensis TaxID=32201 RepID=A0A8T1P0W6_CARIL|nr:alpha carbonic anhydrase 1, chloroplastic-like [Carya illinoinensis]KAG6638076.1 hypothetical protein CIPAW_10G010200 [Carya illinoinensis]